MVAGGPAWLPEGGMRGCGGACVVAGGMCGCWGHAWLPGTCVVVGGVHGCQGRTWLPGGMHGCGGGGVRRIRDTVNERAVRIYWNAFLLQIFLSEAPLIFEVYLSVICEQHHKNSLNPCSNDEKNGAKTVQREPGFKLNKNYIYD